MTIEEFNSYNETLSMPKEDIGQGNGYKADVDWDMVNMSDIIYIPEYGYEDTNFVKRTNAYTKQDLIDVVKYACENIKDDRKIDHIAMTLFEELDWQFPTSLLDDWITSGVLSEDE